jgi:pilus assembly protein CpaB
MLKTLLFLLMAAGVLGFSAVAWISLHPPPPPVVQVQKVAVLAAAGTLRAGTLLKPDDLEIREVVEGEVPTGARRDTPQARSELFGAMVRQTLLAHQFILPADVMRPGDHGFLAAVLSPGKRATSVGVDAVSGTAGLIWPGDHVDLILTQQIEDPSVPIGRRYSGETVLKDVRVIAIDQQLVQGGGAGGADSANQSRTVTLEVSPEDAEKVAVATRLGKLSLAVRPVDSPAAVGKADNDVTYSQDVSKAIDNLSQKNQAPVAVETSRPSIHILSPATDKEYKF